MTAASFNEFLRTNAKSGSASWWRQGTGIRVGFGLGHSINSTRDSNQPGRRKKIARSTILKKCSVTLCFLFLMHTYIGMQPCRDGPKDRGKEEFQTSMINTLLLPCCGSADRQRMWRKQLFSLSVSQICLFLTFGWCLHAFFFISSVFDLSASVLD